jgi:hypothetical protein
MSNLPDVVDRLGDALGGDRLIDRSVQSRDPIYREFVEALCRLQMNGIVVGKGILLKEILAELGGTHPATVKKVLRAFEWVPVRMGGILGKKLRGSVTAWYPRNSFDWRPPEKTLERMYKIRDYQDWCDNMRP